MNTVFSELIPLGYISFIDGVKMSDPSSADNSFYMESIMKSSIERVEILKGNQSSLYGSNAIGGTIHIFTKKGKEGNHSNLEVEIPASSRTLSLHKSYILIFMNKMNHP